MTESSVGVPKSKIKTRHQAQPETDSLEQTLNDTEVESPQDVSPKIAVTERAFGVISHMFPETSEEAARIVAWDIFVHGMSDLGFTASGAGGSAAVFHNEDSAQGNCVRGKIVFHRPHPVAKIDPVMIRSMGKRMAKWFGWRRDLFVLDSHTSITATNVQTVQ